MSCKRKRKRDFFHSHVIRVLILIGLSISRPLFLYNPTIFFISTGTLLLVAGLFFHIYIPKGNLLLDFYVTLIRFTIFLSSLALIIGGLLNSSAAHNKVVVLLVLYAIVLIFLVGIGEVISRIIYWLKKPVLKRFGRYKLLAIVMGLFGLLIALVLPDLVFGYGYKLYFEVLIEKDITEQWKYLGFVISHTLPVTDINLEKIIATINSTPELQYFQMFQIYLVKIIEWIVIAILLNSLLKLLRGNDY